MRHALTDVSSKHINGTAHRYRHAEEGASEWTKAARPSGTELSLPVSTPRVCALMDADFAADDSFRSPNNPSVCSGVHILLRSVCECVSEIWIWLNPGMGLGPTKWLEGKDRTMS